MWFVSVWAVVRNNYNIWERYLAGMSVWVAREFIIDQFMMRIEHNIYEDFKSKLLPAKYLNQKVYIWREEHHPTTEGI